MSKNNDASEAAVDALTSQLPGHTETFQVKERTYVVQELPVDAFVELGNIISDEADTLADAGLLTEDTWKIDKGDYTQLVKKIATVWKHVPTIVDRVFVILLSGEAPDDGEYIRKHITPRQLLEVIRAFMRTNPWGDLAEGFFLLGKEWAAQGRDISQEKQPTS